MKRMTKRLLSLVFAVVMIVTMLPASIFAAEEKVLPEAEVTKLEALTLTAADDYMVWPSGDASINRPLEIVVSFKALDTLEECLAGGYADWLVDFNLTFTGLANDTLIADNCYLAGNYGKFGWVVIPTDGLEIENGMTYPVVAAYDATLNYKDICESVQNFTAALHIDQAIIDANPDLEVKLELVMTNPNDETHKIQIGEDMIYTFGKKVLPEAEVTKQPETALTDYRVWEGGSKLVAGEGELPLNAVVNFKALDTLEECLAGGYAQWLVDFNLTIEGLEGGSLTIEGDKCYLAGNYGSFGWIKIPLEGMTVENGVAYPVVSFYDPTLNYKDICKSVKDFTAALYIDQEIINANPDLKINLQLIMTNPEDDTDKIQIGEDIVYTWRVLPQAEVTKQPETALTDYRVWEGGSKLVAGEGKLPLNAVVNLKALDTLEECLAGGYAQWLVDFNLTIEGLEGGSLTIEGDKCYLAGYYGSFGWIKIPLEGMTVENGVAYPVVSFYDPTLNYKDICKSVKDFTAALYIDQEIINANPDLKINLQLIMTNPEDETDKIQIGEDIVYTFEVEEIYVAQNVQTGVKYTTVQDGIDEATDGHTVILLRNVTEAEVYVRRDRTLDLNGFALTSDDVAVHSTSYLVDNTNGKGVLLIEENHLSLDIDNLQLPVWTDNGYRFSDVKFAQKATMSTSDRAYYRFYVKGDDAECMLANEMENGGLDNGVTVEVRLSWTDAEGSVSEKTYVFLDSDLKDYAANWTGNMFYLYINGVEELSNLTVTPTFVSRAGEEAEVIIVGETVVVK